MADLYSFLLTCALICLMAASCLLIFLRLRSGSPKAKKILLLARLFGIAAVLITAIAACLHFFADHSASSSTPLTPQEFILEHPATAIIGIAAAATIILARLRR